MQWQNEKERNDFSKEADKMGIGKMSEYIRAIHREHKEKSKKHD